MGEYIVDGAAGAIYSGGAVCLGVLMYLPKPFMEPFVAAKIALTSS